MKNNLKDFNLIMISAGFEQGGNTLHRFLDGHPNLFIYPFESMMGTPLSSNVLDSYVRYRYRWPEFTSEITPNEAYDLIADAEYKTFARTPFTSKFEHCGADFSENDRRMIFINHFAPRTRRDCIEAYFRSVFVSWKNYKSSGKETYFVGYCPTIVVETDKILRDFPTAHIIHVIRNPWSGYADTQKRLNVVSIEKYCQTWNILQLYATNYRNKYPRNFHIITYENLIRNKRLEMSLLLQSMGIEYSENVLYPSFNGKELKEMYPWGTIRKATEQANIDSLKELSSEQKNKILNECNFMLDIFGYKWLYGL